MNKWRYKVVVISYDKYRELNEEWDDSKHLNHLGERHWELVEIVFWGGWPIGYFKKPRLGGEDEGKN